MIFRKPYAFFIKHFKLINFILAILTIYVSKVAYSIIKFFNDFITNGYSGNTYPGFYQNYIPILIYFILILLIIGVILISLLFFYKKKPNKLYLISLVYFIIYFIFILYVRNTMIYMETDVITAEKIRILRDLSIILFAPQVVFILFYLTRTFGIDLEKFKFNEDLKKEFELSDKDNEEVEISFNKDGIKLKRNVRRFIREYKYYLKENKFVIIFLGIIVLLIGGYLLIKNIPEIKNQNIKQGTLFNINELQYNVEDSIVTNLDYKGDLISKDKYYVVIKLNILNTSTIDSNFVYNNFRLEIGKKYLYPLKEKETSFIDYANNYGSNIIKPDNEYLYVLVYEIDKDDLKDSYKLRVRKVNEDYYYVKINPVLLDKIIVSGNYLQNEKVTFTNSYLGKSELLLNNALITDRYIYDYESCDKEKCNTYKDVISIDYTSKSSLIVFDYEFLMDSSIPFSNVTNDIYGFADKYMKVKYLDNDEIKYADVTNVTPNNLKDKLVISTTNKIKDTSSLEISIIVRNKEFLIKIK